MLPDGPLDRRPDQPRGLQIKPTHVLRSRSSTTLPLPLQAKAPTCAQPCLKQDIVRGYNNCPRHGLACLCQNYSSQGFTLGELAYLCLHQSCSQTSRDQSLALYNICSDISGAVSATHNVLTATPTGPTNPPTSASTAITSTSRRTTDPFATRPSGTASLSTPTSHRDSHTVSSLDSSTSRIDRSSSSRAVPAGETTSATSHPSGPTSSEIAGVVIGVLAFVLIMAAAIFYSCFRRRKTDENDRKKLDFLSCFRRRRSSTEDHENSYDFIDKGPPPLSSTLTIKHPYDTHIPDRDTIHYWQQLSTTPGQQYQKILDTLPAQTQLNDNGQTAAMLSAEQASGPSIVQVLPQPRNPTETATNVMKGRVSPAPSWKGIGLPSNPRPTQHSPKKGSPARHPSPPVDQILLLPRPQILPPNPPPVQHLTKVDSPARHPSPPVDQILLLASPQTLPSNSRPVQHSPRVDSPARQPSPIVDEILLLAPPQPLPLAADESEPSTTLPAVRIWSDRTVVSVPNTPDPTATLPVIESRTDTPVLHLQRTPSRRIETQPNSSILPSQPTTDVLYSDQPLSAVSKSRSTRDSSGSLLNYYASSEAGVAVSPVSVKSPGSVTRNTQTKPSRTCGIVPRKSRNHAPPGRRDSAGSDTSFESSDEDEPSTTPGSARYLCTVPEAASSPVGRSPIADIKYPSIPKSANHTLHKRLSQRDVSPRAITPSLPHSPKTPKAWQDPCTPTDDSPQFELQQLPLPSMPAADRRISDQSILSGSTLVEKRQGKKKAHGLELSLDKDESAYTAFTKFSSPKTNLYNRQSRNYAPAQPSPLKDYERPPQRRQRSKKKSASRREREQVATEEPERGHNLTPERKGDDLYLRFDDTSPMKNMF